jgi:hypothetical protein
MKQTASFAVLALVNNVSASRLNTIAQSRYVDGSHVVSSYETTGPDSNRDHPSPQVKAPEVSTQQRGKADKGSYEGYSHYWATNDMARQQGWSNEINPWSLHLNNSLIANEAFPKAESAYTSLIQKTGKSIE